MESRGLLNKKAFTLIISGSAIIAVSLFLFLYRPLLEEIQSSRIEYAKIMDEIFRAGTFKEFARTVEQKRVLLTEKDRAILEPMNELKRKKELQGVHFISITRKIKNIEEKGEKENALYKALPIEMKVESTYEGLGALFESLDELKQGVVSIENFSIIPNQEGPAQLKTNLLLDMYLYTPAKNLKWPDKVIPSIRKVKKTAYTKWGMSPFIPKEEIQLMEDISQKKPKRKPKPILKLFLIFLHTESPKAVINGKTLGIGDKIDHITIVDIKADKVILNDGEETFELSLGK